MSLKRLPAEWEPQDAVWLAWPANEELWPENRPRVKNRFAALIKTLSNYVQVHVICPATSQHEIERLLFNGCALLANIHFFHFETNDVWCRDFGPLFTVDDKGLVISDWEFNGWGGQYNSEKDNTVSTAIATERAIPLTTTNAILEGGAIDVNGHGQLLTTKAVLLNQNRNPQLSMESYEELFLQHFGVTQTIWLDAGLVNDDTDGHIDNIARFVKNGSILIASCEPDNINYKNLQNNKRILEITLIEGKAPTLIELPLPDPIFFNGQPLTASYLNFISINELILVPSFEQPRNDQQAQKILQACFPSHQVNLFNCLDFIQEGGALHCLSMNQPKTSGL